MVQLQSGSDYTQECAVKNLQNGMVLADKVFDEEGIQVLDAGVVINPYVKRLLEENSIKSVCIEKERKEEPEFREVTFTFEGVLDRIYKEAKNPLYRMTHKKVLESSLPEGKKIISELDFRKFVGNYQEPCKEWWRLLTADRIEEDFQSFWKIHDQFLPGYRVLVTDIMGLVPELSVWKCEWMEQVDHFEYTYAGEVFSSILFWQILLSGLGKSLEDYIEKEDWKYSLKVLGRVASMGLRKFHQGIFETLVATIIIQTGILMLKDLGGKVWDSFIAVSQGEQEREFLEQQIFKIGSKSTGIILCDEWGINEAWIKRIIKAFWLGEKGCDEASIIRYSWFAQSLGEPREQYVWDQVACLESDLEYLGGSPLNLYSIVQ